MPVLENPTHERFAQELVRPGNTQAEAYTAVGLGADSTGDSIAACASRMAARPEVRARVAELQERSAKRVELKRADILGMLLDDRTLARDSKQAAAAIKATELLGKEVAGMFVDRKEIKHGPLDGLDIEQLEELRRQLESAGSDSIVEGDRTDESVSEDRNVLPGPWAAPAGALQKAS